MAQQNNKFTAFWMDTTTAPWVPLTGLSATINIRDVSGNLVVDNQPMTELWWWHYIYTFTGYNPAVDYVYDCNPWATAYIESWVTNNIEQLISEIRVWGAWATINTSGITGSIANMQKAITKQISEIPKTDLSEIKSHIDIAKTDIIDTIESIEQPEYEMEEKEAKKAVKLLTTLDKKVSSYIDSEMKEKEELSILTRELNKLDIEDEMKSKEEKRKEEEEKKMKEEEHKKMLEEQAKMLEIEFDKLDEEEKEEKRKELEKELEEAKKEVTEIEIELKSL